MAFTRSSEKENCGISLQQLICKRHTFMRVLCFLSLALELSLGWIAVQEENKCTVLKQCEVLYCV